MDAVAECELYGGWLVNIESLAEQNCLMRYAQKNSLFNNFWTDGINLHIMDFNWVVVLIANDIETEGVFVHASTGKDLTWVNSKWFCGSEVNSQGGDAFTWIVRSDGRFNGNWCDADVNNGYKFICKAHI